MKMNISDREKRLVFFVVLSLVFLLYWYLMLSPALASLNKVKGDITAGQLELRQLNEHLKAEMLAAKDRKKIKLYPREEQSAYILGFLDKRFKWFGIQLNSLLQSSEGNKLTLEFKFKSTYYQFLGLLNSLSELETLLVIDHVNVVQEGTHLITEMKVLSGHL